jgi:hypothetical protein
MRKERQRKLDDLMKNATKWLRSISLKDLEMQKKKTRDKNGA